MKYLVHHGVMHSFESFEQDRKSTVSGWITYVAQNGSRYGASLDLMAETREEALSKYRAHCLSQIKRNIEGAISELAQKLNSISAWESNYFGEIAAI